MLEANFPLINVYPDYNKSPREQPCITIDPITETEREGLYGYTDVDMEVTYTSIDESELDHVNTSNQISAVLGDFDMGETYLNKPTHPTPDNRSGKDFHVYHITPPLFEYEPMEHGMSSTIGLTYVTMHMDG